MGIKIISENRKAFFNYEILERFEAGIVLTGSEVKSIRDGKVNLGDSYGMMHNGEAFLIHTHISVYNQASYNNHEPLRMRKLLLHRSELDKLVGKIQEKGFTLVPLKMYLKEGKVKVEMGVGKSKKTHDKRESIKKKDTNREIQRAMKKK